MGAMPEILSVVRTAKENGSPSSGATYLVRCPVCRSEYRRVGNRTQIEKSVHCKSCDNRLNPRKKRRPGYPPTRIDGKKNPEYMRCYRRDLKAGTR